MWSFVCFCFHAEDLTVQFKWFFKGSERNGIFMCLAVLLFLSFDLGLPCWVVLLKRTRGGWQGWPFQLLYFGS